MRKGLVMRILLIVAMLCACSSYSRFEVDSEVVGVGHADVAESLMDLGWDIKSETEREVVTKWHLLRLRDGVYVNEIQVRVVADIERGTARGYCTQRRVSMMGKEQDPWWFAPCTEPRALEMIDRALRACRGTPWAQ